MSGSPTKAAPPERHVGLRLLARIIFGLTILGVAASVWLSILDPLSQGIDLLVVTFFLFPVIGYLLATRRPDNAVSWLTLGVGAAVGVSAFLGAYASYAIHGGIGGTRAGEIASALD
ncbi:MAG: hypothetical protein ABJB55_03255 [Actinomycetota bacterium]